MTGTSLRMISRGRRLAAASLACLGLAANVWAGPWSAAYALPAAPPLAEGESGYASTYVPGLGSFAIRNATILTADGPVIEKGTIVVREGKIAAVGPNVGVPAGIPVIDGTGKWVSPGIIDPHSHIGVNGNPMMGATETANELSSPNTAEARVEHSLRVDDPAFARARESGVTAMQVLPGSGNVFGGRTVVLKNVRAVSVEGMKFPGAPYGLKIACGENPPRVYGKMKNLEAPGTPMEAFAIERAAFIAARDYGAKQTRYRDARAAGRAATAPLRDLKLETLAGVLDGTIRVNIHCYRADQMVQQINLSKEFGYRISTFHHATEAYKIARLLAAEKIAVASWRETTGLKLESFASIPENGAFIDRAGGMFAVHSDSENVIQNLHSDAGRIMAVGNRLGWNIDPAKAIRWVTINPAAMLGIDGQTGSLTVGKNGDVVIWNRNPLSIYSLAEKVFIDGTMVFDRDKPLEPDSDFTLGNARRN